MKSKKLKIIKKPIQNFGTIYKIGRQQFLERILFSKEVQRIHVPHIHEYISWSHVRVNWGITEAWLCFSSSLQAGLEKWCGPLT
jgi:hypothetical protein